MQISRHWRMQKQRYMLQGFRYEDGTLSISGQKKFKEVDVPDEEETPIAVPNWPVKKDSALKKPE